MNYGVTYIPTHPKHPMNGIRIALSNHYEIRRNPDGTVRGEFIPWVFDSLLAASNYCTILNNHIQGADAKSVPVPVAVKYGKQEAELLACTVKEPYLPT